MRVVKTQGTEQARGHRVHLGFLHPVIQLQIREAAAGGLDESLIMLQPRMPENHQSAASQISAFQNLSFYPPQLRLFVDSTNHSSYALNSPSSRASSAFGRTKCRLANSSGQRNLQP